MLHVLLFLTAAASTVMGETISVFIPEDLVIGQQTTIVCRVSAPSDDTLVMEFRPEKPIWRDVYFTNYTYLNVTILEGTVDEVSYQHSNTSVICRSERYNLTAQRRMYVERPDKIEWDLNFSLLTINNNTNEVVETYGPEGVVVAHIWNRENGTMHGTVCDDRIDMYTVDTICRQMNYTRGKSWSNIEAEYNSIKMSAYVGKMGIALDDLKCYRNATNNIMEDCDYLFFNHDCSHSEDLVITCSMDDGPDSEWEIQSGFLYKASETGGEPYGGPEGVIGLGIRNIYDGTMKFGFTCGPRMSKSEANLVCRALGFPEAIWWKTYRSVVQEKYLPVNHMAEQDIVLSDFSCPDNATSIEECSYTLMPESPGCQPERDAIVMKCNDAEFDKLTFRLNSFDKYGYLTTDEREGFVMVHKYKSNGEHEYGTVCDDHVGEAEANVICRSMGYPGAERLGHIYDFDNYGQKAENVTRNYRIAIDQLDCGSSNTTIPDIEEDCDFEWFNHDCSHTEDLVLICTEKEIMWEVFDGGLFNGTGDDVNKGNEGVVGVGIKHKESGDEIYGFVCSRNNYMDQHTADIACRALGFASAKWWDGYENITVHYLPEEVMNINRVVLSDFYCPAAAMGIDDCTYELMDDDAFCRSRIDALVMSCHESEPEPDHIIDHFELYSFNSTGGITNRGPMGVVVAIGKDDFGTVCDDNVGPDEAEAICRSMGYDGYSQKGNIYDFIENFGDRMLLVTSEMNIAIDQLNCPHDNVTNIEEECNFDWFKHDCSHSEDLVLSCGEKVEPIWELYETGLYYATETDDLEKGPAGLLVFGLSMQHENEAHEMMGFVCGAGMSSHAANILCQKFGYGSYEWWARYGTAPTQFIPEYWLDGIHAIVTDFYCPDGAEEFEECNYRVLGPDEGCFANQNAIVISCHHDNPKTSPPPITSEHPTTSPQPITSEPDDLDDEVEYKFGGLELKLKLSPKEGRADVEDIIEEIADILG